MGHLHPKVCFEGFVGRFGVMSVVSPLHLACLVLAAAALLCRTPHAERGEPAQRRAHRITQIAPRDP